MKATELMIGNLVCMAENIFPPDIVVALEPGLIHLSKREFPDDENNVEGVPISLDYLKRNGSIVFKSFFYKDFTFEINGLGNMLTLKINNRLKLNFSFVHELQNFISHTQIIKCF